jgi:biopolymer transport protein ExbB/TolQ
MTAVDLVREMLHLIAGVLIWPVLLGLIFLLVWVAISLGAFLRQWYRRKNGEKAEYNELLEALKQCIVCAKDDPDLDLRMEELMQLADQKRLSSIYKLRLGIRLGPSLGLMGTLIPMADALQGLSDGNLPSLASNMVTAFAATVVGLLISVLAYIISSQQEKWLKEDSRAIAFQAERLMRRLEGERKAASVESSANDHSVHMG